MRIASLLPSAVVFLLGCNLLFGEEDEAPRLTGDGKDPVEPLEQGEERCERVTEDMECESGGAEVGMVADCVCPRELGCNGNTLMHCEDGELCTLSWKSCGGIQGTIPRQTCIEDGEFGTGCYVDGKADADGYVEQCELSDRCANDEEIDHCVTVPKFLGWDAPIPDAGAPGYSCFEDCWDSYSFPESTIDCGQCCDACDLPREVHELLCEGIDDEPAGDDGGGATCLGDSLCPSGDEITACSDGSACWYELGSRRFDCDDCSGTGCEDAAQAALDACE